MGKALLLNLMSNKLGDCYKAAYEASQELQELGKSVFLVHGWITPINGPDAERRICHAWIEDGGTCWEVSNAQKASYSTKAYYRLLSVELIARYSANEARELALNHGYIGLWNMGDK